MSVSVVIPTMLSRRGLGRTLESVIRSASVSSGDAEVIVVVNGSEGRQAPTVGSALVRFIELERANAPGARNAGIAAARHKAIIFTDDDCQVPEGWCSEMDRALNTEGHAAVAAPVRTAVKGPVTAFIDHQRILDAPAIAADRVRSLVTANCGYRRDLASPGFRFDGSTFNSGGDTDFGYRLRDAGHLLHWLGSADPVIHHLSESIGTITRRFIRYGRGNARLVLRRDRWRESVPGGLDWYRDITRGSYVEYRRFSEFPDPDVRATFSVLDLLLKSSFLVGYLEEAGHYLDHLLIEPDHDALQVAWDRLEERLRSRVGRSNWGDLGSAFERLASPDRSVGGDGVATVAAGLRVHAPLAESVSPSVATRLGAWRDEFDVEIERANRRLFKAWDALRATRSSIGADDMERIVRGAGTTFGDGCHDVEKLMYSRGAGHGPGPAMPSESRS